MIREHLATVLERDPAAKSSLEVFWCYSGLHAEWFYRINHWLWNHCLLLPARWLSQVARWLTGIEIHPGAGIGRHFRHTPSTWANWTTKDITVSQTMRHAKPDMTTVYTRANFQKALDAQRLYRDQLLKMKPASE